MGKLENATFLSGNVNDKICNIKSKSVQTVITSPPYWGLRDYEEKSQLGFEDTPKEYSKSLVGVFEKVRRVIKDDGTLWLNVGDSYANPRSGKMVSDNLRSTNVKVPDGLAKNRDPRCLEKAGLKDKDLCMIPSELAMALRDDGWWLRSRIVWYKLNPRPESVKDRPTNTHEYLFLFSKSKNYYYDHDAIKELSAATGNERNKRDVWVVNSIKSFGGVHFATYPVDLVEPCVLAGSKRGETVLDPFSGTGTTGIAALKNNRKYIGIELNEKYNEIAKKRIKEHKEVPMNHRFW